MKRNFLALTAVVVAIALVSFTSKPLFTDVYMVYTQTSTSTEKVFANYTQQSTSPGIITNEGILTLAWAKFVDDDGTVLSTEFDAEFEVLDVTSTSSNRLSDETENGSTIEKK